MTNKKRFFIFTLGCKINQYESEAIRESWISKGFVEVEDVKDADVVIVNSCAVTEMAVSDVKKYIRRFSRENPNCEIIVTGCAIPKWENVIKSFENVKYIVPQKQKAILKDYPELDINNKQSIEHFSLTISNYFRARPVVKIQDGCSHYCRYCIVPLTRGASVSRDIRDILDEVKRLLDNGFHELIISGINLREFKTSYNGKDIDVWDLVEIISKIMAKDYKGSRIRLSSLDPSLLNNKALRVLNTCENIAKHLHLSIQSADRDILKKMGRAHYTPDHIEQFIEKLSNIWRLFGLGCDVLVGFPGESDSNFENTYEFCKRMPFTYAHVFQYSKRPGTPAAKYPDQVPKQLKKERSRRLRELFVGKKKEFLKKQLQLNNVSVVVEDRDKLVGMNEYYVICEILNGNKGDLKKGDLVKARPVCVDFEKKNLIVSLE